MSKVYPIRNMSDVENLLEYLEYHSQRNYVLAATCLYSGLRIGDALKLKVRDVKGKTNFNLKEDKTDKEFIRPINKKLKKIYKEYCKDKRTNEYLFKSREGYNKPISESQAWRIFNNAAKKVRISTNVGTHSLRKTFAWNLYKKDKDIELVRKALNHSSSIITKRYLNINDIDVEKAIQELDFGI